MITARSSSVFFATISVLALVVGGLLAPEIKDLVLNFDPLKETASNLLSPFSLARSLILPLGALVALGLTVGPGAALAAGLWGVRDMRITLIQGFGLSVSLVPIILSVMHSLGMSHSMLTLSFAVILVSLMGIFVAYRRPRDELAPIGKEGFVDIGLAIALLLAIVYILAPKLALEAFNSDGLHMLTTARRLIEANTPFWPPDSAYLNEYPDLRTFAPNYPIVWFVLLWGEHEFSARVLFVPIVFVLFLAILSLSDSRDGRGLGVFDRIIFALSMIVFSVSYAYSASYEIYSDIALPLIRESFFCFALLSAVLFCVRRNMASSCLFGILATLTIPTGGALVLATIGLIAVLHRSEPESKVGLAAMLATLSTLALTLVLPILFQKLSWSMPGQEFSSVGILGRLRYISLSDWEDFLFVLVPVSIVPIAAIVLFLRRGDRVGITLTLVGVSYFLFFYIQAFQSMLHHFMPAALLLLAAFWRFRALDARPLWPLRVALGVGLVASLALAWPATLVLEHRPQILAKRILVDASLREDFSARTILDLGSAINEAIPVVPYAERFERGVPANEGEVLGYYARRTTGRDEPPFLRLGRPAAGVGEGAVRSVVVEYADKAAIQAELAKFGHATRHAPAIGARPEKVFRREEAVAEQADRLIDIKRLIPGRR